MKPKKFNKKLSFDKSTIADLNSKELNNVRGMTGQKIGLSRKSPSKWRRCYLNV